jgi:hypothetical protein
MSKYTVHKILLSIFVAFILPSCSSRPALPGQSEEPEAFSTYIEKADTSLANSKKEVAKAEAAVIESRKLLDEARALHASMVQLKKDKEAAAKKAQTERIVWERKRAEAERKKKEEEERMKAEAEATPTPPPYSASDAPVKKK